MKKYIILFSLFIIGMAAHSQTLILVNGDSIDLKTDFIITPKANTNYYSARDYDQIEISTKDTVYNFDIRELATLKFAAYYTSSISNIKTEEAVILYDEPGDRVVVHNGTDNATIAIYNSKGAFVKSARGNEISTKGLHPGVYIVSYNNKSNAKILKK